MIPVFWRVASDSPLYLSRYRPDVSISWALPQALASSGILLPSRMRLAPTLQGDQPHRELLGVTPFLISIARTLRVTLSTGFGDSAGWSVRWLPASYPLPFWLQRLSLFRWFTFTMARHVFAHATHRFLLDRVSGLRLPDTAVYPRFRPLRASRKPGGYAFTSAPEGQGLHLHRDKVTRLKG
jgi:hypothetical protein